MTVDGAGVRCSFCYRHASTSVKRHHRTAWQIIRGLPASDVPVCRGHVWTGVRYVRRWF